ncbi:hypothetical protein LZ30DRAFT_749830 [Colletotrichum cereale]|nr:hypothetical protein LZ30DRAFT_749830 [Colletotrichum cereale]
MFPEAFNLSAPPDTDVWKKPPSHNVYNAPIQALPTKSLSQFKSAKITFSGEWSEQYDQAGLILTFDSLSGRDRRWIKTGLEFYNGAPQLSTVTTHTWSDWSVAPLAAFEDTKSITVYAEKAQDELGLSLWVYYVKQDGTKEPLREVTWVYGDDDASGKDWNLTVGALVARPAKNVGCDLEVQFKDFEVQWE